MWWFSADLHLGHSNCIKYNDRPYSNVEEMDNSILDNFASVIKPNDTLCLLGDTCFTGRDLREYMKRIPGQKIFINGNHDPKQFDKDIFAGRFDVKMVQVNGQNIWLSHYAHRTWPQAHYGAWHLYGHTHGMLEDYSLSTDVGVDAWGMMPVSFDMLVEHFNGRENLHAIKKAENKKTIEERLTRCK